RNRDVGQDHVAVGAASQRDLGRGNRELVAAIVAADDGELGHHRLLVAVDQRRLLVDRLGLLAGRKRWFGRNGGRLFDFRLIFDFGLIGSLFDHVTGGQLQKTRVWRAVLGGRGLRAGIAHFQRALRRGNGRRRTAVAPARTVGDRLLLGI